MLRFHRDWKVILAAGLIVVACFGVAALFTQVDAAGPCICPKLYAPVICDNGKIYPNLCYAECRNAEGCVPLPL